MGRNLGIYYDRFVRAVAGSKLVGWPLVRVATVIDRLLMRFSKGHLSSASGSEIGRQTLLLHCKGARTGVVRHVPLLFARENDHLILLASRAGTNQHPNWYHNLRENPHCQVTLAGQTQDYTAEQTEGQERQRLWQLATRINPAYDQYAQQTHRIIPVLRLRPTAGLERTS